jgi:lipopolysaccharide transport system ATP-binding protein
MKDVSGQGRTVLFVSHNMVAMNALCNSAIFLERGRIKLIGKTSDIIAEYLNLNTGDKKQQIEFPADKDKSIQILSAGLYDNKGELLIEQVDLFEQINLKIKYNIKRKSHKIHLVNNITDQEGKVIYFMDRTDFHKNYFSGGEGIYEANLRIQSPLLKTGKYFFTIYISDEETNEIDCKTNVLSIEIINLKSFRADRTGFLFLPIEWPMFKIN